MINNRFLIALLGLAALLQLSYAVPVPDDDVSDSCDDDKQYLKQFAVFEFNNVAANVVPKEINVLKEVLKDLKADEKRTLEAIKRIEFILKDADEANKDSDKMPLEMFFEINCILSPYDEDYMASEKNPKIHDLLQKHGWKNVLDMLDAQIVPKVDELDNKVNEFYNKLSKDEQKNNKDVAKWIEQYNDKENDAGDKLNLLLQFIMVSHDESNESK